MAQLFDVVTGGAGFIGSHLVRSRLESGVAVRVVDDFSSGRRENLAGLSEEHGSRLEVHVLDIRDLESLRKVFSGTRWVFHQAAVPSVPRSIHDPINSTTANIDGTLNVLVAARDANVEKVVYASSSSVYGDTEELPKHEGLALRPLSPYAITKLAGELYAENFSRLYDLPTYGLRYFNVFGPSQDPGSDYAAVIPRFITRMLDGKPPIIYGDGDQTRDFTYVENVVDANLRAAAASAEGIAANIGCGARYSLNELVGVLNEILGTSLEPIYEAARDGDVRHSLADIERARTTLGFDPRVDFASGLRRTVEWFQKQREG